MRKIYKYVLTITDEQTLRLPQGANFLTAQMQREQLCIWVEVDTDRPLEPCTFLIHGTGNPIGAERKRYIATVQDGPMVWHVFLKLP